MELQLDQNTEALVIVYGPGKDEIVRKKHEYWEKLTEMIENID